MDHGTKVEPSLMILAQKDFLFVTARMGEASVATPSAKRALYE
jgi:hypothetical protein